ncbi:MAG: serine protease [Lachnospiraceae bacterium]|nr:serine protease [Lachnospiraceae bacterium]
MRKTLRGFLRELVVVGVIVLLAGRICAYQPGFAVSSCVSDRTAISAAQAVRRGVAANEKLDTEGIGMQIVYQLAKRSIVKVVVKDAAGSGIIWKIEDGIVIVSSKHLLMKDVKAEIVFGNGETISADVIGYSQQYDIGFVKIPDGAVTDSILRDIYEAVPALYEIESEEARTAFVLEYFEKRVLQMGALSDKNTDSFSLGNIQGIRFVPLFNTHMLETACYSKAGMSGGGVFDESGRFLGMISGGDVPEDAEKREAEITYSIPSVLIAAAYEEIMYTGGRKD